MSEDPLLRVDKLEVVYHRAVTAVQGINLRVEGGQIVAILGTNGAGKTTTLRAISGFLGIDDAKVTDGAITYNGHRIENRPPDEITRLGIVLVPERDKVFPNLTVAENLAVPLRVSAGPAKSSSFIPFHVSPTCGPGPPAFFPAASGRCWRSAARWSAGRNCFWSTSYRSASLRPSLTI